MKHKLISFAIAVIMIMSGASASFAASFASFTDAQSHWAKSSLQRAVEEAVLNGSNGKLEPNGDLSGGQMISILVRALNIQLWDKIYPGTSTDDWYYRQAAIAYTAGLLPEDGSIKMTSPISRAEVFLALAKAYYGYGASVSDLEAAEKAEEMKEQQEARELQNAEQAPADTEETDQIVTSTPNSIALNAFHTNAYTVKESEDTSFNTFASDSDTGIVKTGDPVSDNTGDVVIIEDTQVPVADSGIITEGALVPAEVETPAAQVVSTPAAETSGATPEVLSRFADGSQLSGDYASAAAILLEKGIVTGDDENKLNPSSTITRAEFVTMLYRLIDSPAGQTTGALYRGYDPSLTSIQLQMNVPDVAAGGTLTADVKFTGIASEITCDAAWMLNGDGVEGFSATNKVVHEGDVSSFNSKIKFTRYMTLTRNVGFEMTMGNNHVFTEKVAFITNYPDTYYYTPPTVNTSTYAEALKKVTSVYSSKNSDYSTAIKEAFVNGKGYTSKTDYLLWVNLGTQRVNVFKKSGSNWTLMNTYKCASGAKSTPTPLGVTYVTYKQTAWITDEYCCKNIVRFYPGTGYAFHSILYYPNGKTIKSGGVGSPRSHGCIRMLQPDITWIYNNIPVNTTVVIY